MLLMGPEEGGDGIERKARASSLSSSRTRANPVETSF